MNGTRDIVSEQINFNALLDRKLLTQSSDSWNKPQSLQRRGMQPVRKCMEISAKFAGRIQDIVNLPDSLIRRGSYCFFRILQFECHYRQTLAKIVMDFRRNATPLSLLCTNQHAAER